MNEAEAQDMVGKFFKFEGQDVIYYGLNYEEVRERHQTNHFLHCTRMTAMGVVTNTRLTCGLQLEDIEVLTVEQIERYLNQMRARILTGMTFNYLNVEKGQVFKCFKKADNSAEWILVTRIERIRGAQAPHVGAIRYRETLRTIQEKRINLSAFYTRYYVSIRPASLEELKEVYHKKGIEAPLELRKNFDPKNNIV